MKSSSVKNERGDLIGTLIDNHGVLDTMINIPSVLKDIEDELIDLKPDSFNYPVDARISCIIKLKNGREKRMCIGGYLANYIEYCGVNQKQKNRLLYLIKKNIGYYSWMGDHILDYSEELQDKSFFRDSVIGYSGKQY